MPTGSSNWPSEMRPAAGGRRPGRRVSHRLLDVRGGQEIHAWQGLTSALGVVKR
jgi:hypothetical protein